MNRSDVVLFPPRTPRRAAEPLLRHVVGPILRARRKEQGRTLDDVARSARVSTPYLSEVERGRKEASSEILAAICASLGFGLVDLVGEAYSDLSATTSRPASSTVSGPVASVSLMVA